MSTLLLSEIFPPKKGGSGRWFWEVYSRLHRQEFCFAVGEDPQQAEFDRSHDWNLHRIPLTLSSWGVKSWSGLQGYRRALSALKPLLKANNVSMVHCGRVLPEGVMARWLSLTRGISYLCFVHGEDVTTARYSRELTWLVARVLKKATVLIVNSQNTARILRDDWHVPDAKIRVLHPGVDTKRFVPVPKDSQVRADLGWHDRKVLLTVGRLQKRKGHDNLIRALPKIRESHPDVLYAMIGAGDEKSFLQNLVRELDLHNHVQFLGETDDDQLIRSYQQCDLFLLPNRQDGEDIEGFGMVLVEAQACGRPVLAGDSGGTRETMRIPETGIIIDCTDPEKIAAEVSQLLAKPQQLDQMGLRARDWVVSNFDWQALSSQANTIFHEAVARARGVGNSLSS